VKEEDEEYVFPTHLSEVKEEEEEYVFPSHDLGEVKEEEDLYWKVSCSYHQDTSFLLVAW
jgi:hypothetical protein